MKFLKMLFSKKKKTKKQLTQAVKTEESENVSRLCERFDQIREASGLSASDFISMSFNPTVADTPFFSPVEESQTPFNIESFSGFGGGDGGGAGAGGSWETDNNWDTSCNDHSSISFD